MLFIYPYKHTRERLQADSEMSIHEMKSQLLSQFHQDKLDHDKIIEELKTQLQFTEEKSKLEVETCRMDCIAEVDNVRKEHEEELYRSLETHTIATSPQPPSRIQVDDNVRGRTNH